MKDKEFKSLSHVYGAYAFNSCGSAVDKGYRPDLTVKDENENIIFIFENERKSKRKAFVGDLVKAYKYCDESKNEATLIIVLEEDEKRTVSNISNHLKIYFDWLKMKDNFKSYLKNVIIISDIQYQNSIKNNEPIGSSTIFNRGQTL